MHPWARIRRLLALAVTVLFMLATLVSPVLAGSRGFSVPRSSSFRSSSRSFSTPKVSTPSSPSRSFSTPKASIGSSPSRAYSSPSPTPSSTSKGYSTPASPSYSSGSRSYSSDSRSYSSQRSTTPTAATQTPKPVSPSYDVGRTRYPSFPPVVVIGPSPYDPSYWHDYYYSRPWWWRTWHRPVYYSNTGFAISWVAVVGSVIGIWFLLGIISAVVSKRRR